MEECQSLWCEESVTDSVVFCSDECADDYWLDSDFDDGLFEFDHLGE